MAFDPTTLRSMIKEHGRTVTLRKRAMTGYSAATGTLTTTNTDYKVRAYFYDYTPDMIDDENILRGDRRPRRPNPPLPRASKRRASRGPTWARIAYAWV